ncbi:MAG TPA: 50S ribosomal protein L18 [Patescibacteria group bacterium]|nr:50S ribosomal protein L18 [Patescibacteria group bacterium]
MTKKEQELKRKNRVRQKIKGTNERPRLSVFRSNKRIYTQLINDEQGKTLVGSSEKDLGKEAKPVTKIKKAKLIGEALAKKALKKKIKKVIFDRGPYRYHGRVKALAEGAREGGLKF